MVPAEHLLGECMAKAKSFRCITEANAWRMRSLAGGNAQRMQGECLATPMLCTPLSPLVMARVCVRSCTLRCVSLGRLRTAMGFHKRRQSEGRRTGQGILLGRFTPGYTPVLTTLPERGGTYAEACTTRTAQPEITFWFFYYNNLDNKPNPWYPKDRRTI